MQRRIVDALTTGKWVVVRQKDTYLQAVMPRFTPQGCILLGPQGCVLSDERRPESCRAFIPDRDFANYRCHYPAEIGDQRSPEIYFSKLWQPYQDLLKESLSTLHIMEAVTKS